MAELLLLVLQLITVPFLPQMVYLKLQRASTKQGIEPEHFLPCAVTSLSCQACSKLCCKEEAMYFYEAELKILFNFSKSTTPPFWYIEKRQKY